MSLNKLSTKLDEDIVQRLARPGLDALSRTSKYYRSLMEPYLYKDLVFSKHQAYEIQCLFLTILGRNELAKHIRSFTMTKDEVDMRARSFGKAFYSEMMGHTSVVMQLIQTITEPLADAQFAMRWFSRIFSGLEPFDSTLAVVLCLATNLEGFTLAGGSGPITIDIFRTAWGDLGGRVNIFPFHKLRSFSAGSDCYEGNILPSTTSLRLEGLRESRGSHPEPFNWPYGRTYPGEFLQTLEVINVDFDPY
jgi:hypothetical protein